jgi:uncharacterized protein
MIFKIILLLLVLLIVYVIFFKKKKRKSKDENLSVSDEVMIACVKCDTFISNQDAVIKSGQFYCSKECAGLK